MNNKLTVLFTCCFMLSCKPDNADYPTADVAEQEVREVAYPPEMDVHKDSYEKSALEYISIEATPSKTDPWQSKFLGLPYLLKETPYPRGSDNKPLQLLAQLNFDEIPSLSAYPDTGILQFYISPFFAKKHVWGMYSYSADPFVPDEYFKSMGEQKYFRIIYHDQIVKESDKLLDKVPSFNEGIMPMNKEAALTFNKKTGYVSNSDYRFTNYYGTDAITYFDQFSDSANEVGNQYYQFTYPEGQAWIGGYATFAQGDPRELRQHEDWVLLLEIDSSYENDLDILWGDSGVGTFFIKRKDKQLQLS